MHRMMTLFATVAAVALFDVALPEPIVLDMLGAGLASLGLGLMYHGATGF